MPSARACATACDDASLCEAPRASIRFSPFVEDTSHASPVAVVNAAVIAFNGVGD
jgi:hypothetical protein